MKHDFGSNDATEYSIEPDLAGKIVKELIAIPKGDEFRLRFTDGTELLIRGQWFNTEEAGALIERGDRSIRPDDLRNDRL